MERQIHGFSEQFLNELADRFDLNLDTVINYARICRENDEPGELESILVEVSQELHDEDWFDEPDDGQPSEMQEWHDFDPDC